MTTYNGCTTVYLHKVKHYVELSGYTPKPHYIFISINIRTLHFISKHQKKVLGYSYVLSYFKYCPIVWHFGNISNIHKTEKLHERVIRFIHCDYETDHFTLLNNLNVRTLYANRMENICTEIYKIKNELDPKYMNELITARPSQHQYRKHLD
jgi:hypothetical protein